MGRCWKAQFRRLYGGFECQVATMEFGFHHMRQETIEGFYFLAINTLKPWEFPGGPVVRTQRQGPGFEPWSGKQDPTSRETQQEKKKQIKFFKKRKPLFLCPLVHVTAPSLMSQNLMHTNKKSVQHSELELPTHLSIALLGCKPSESRICLFLYCQHLTSTIGGK